MSRKPESLKLVSYVTKIIKPGKRAIAIWSHPIEGTYTTPALPCQGTIIRAFRIRPELAAPTL